MAFTESLDDVAQNGDGAGPAALGLDDGLVHAAIRALVALPLGLYVVAGFEGLRREPARTYLAGLWQDPGDGRPWPRRLVVTPYDPQTGEVNPAVAAILAGETPARVVGRVAVGAARGKERPFPTFDMLSAYVL